MTDSEARVLGIVARGELVIKDGCRYYPQDGRGIGYTLTMLHLKGLWRWPHEVTGTDTVEGEVAQLARPEEE